MKEDPKDPSSSESSSDDDEGEEEELEADPDEEAREAVEEDKEESSDESAQSELFESNEPPIASGKSALASKGKPALVEAKGQKVPVQLPSRPPAGAPRPCHLHWPGRKRRDSPMIGRR